MESRWDHADHISFLKYSSKHCIKVRSVIPCNSDRSLGTPREELAKLPHIAIISDTNICKSSSIFVAILLPSLGWKLNTYIYTIWTDKKGPFFFFSFSSWNNRNQLWKAGYLIHLTLPGSIPSYLALWHGLETLQTSRNGNSIPALASPFQNSTFSWLGICFQCLIYFFLSALQTYDFLSFLLLT